MNNGCDGCIHEDDCQISPNFNGFEGCSEKKLKPQEELDKDD